MAKHAAKPKWFMWVVLGAAVLLTEDQLDKGALTAAVFELLANGEKRMEMERAIRRFAHPDANRLILEDIKQLVKR